MIQMVLTLIRATRKTTLNCMSSLSVCLVPNVHCKGSQQLRTICTCVTDYTHKIDTHPRCKEQKGFSVSQPLVLCLRNAFDITIRQTIKRYYRLQQLELRFVLQMECVLLITSELNILKQLFNALKCNIQSAQMQSRMSTRGSFRL